MGNQQGDGWFPECEICEAGLLGDDVICGACYRKEIAETDKAFGILAKENNKLRRKFKIEHEKFMEANARAMLKHIDWIKAYQKKCQEDIWNMKPLNDKKKNLLKFQEIKTEHKKIKVKFPLKAGGFVEFPAEEIVAVKKRHEKCRKIKAKLPLKNKGFIDFPTLSNEFFKPKKGDVRNAEKIQRGKKAGL